MTFWSILRQRCWGLVLVVAGVCVITFIISHLIPGDPARLLAGDRASDAIVENIRQQLGLDQPLYVQFYRYVSDLFHGDLGTSIRTGRPGWKSCAYSSRRRWNWHFARCYWHS
ncbi:ABC transporter permease [Escherichia coli]|nr:ABC transporter permease [Escherichia coli]